MCSCADRLPALYVEGTGLPRPTGHDATPPPRQGDAKVLQAVQCGRCYDQQRPLSLCHRGERPCDAAARDRRDLPLRVVCWSREAWDSPRGLNSRCGVASFQGASFHPTRWPRASLKSFKVCASRGVLRRPRTPGLPVMMGRSRCTDRGWDFEGRGVLVQKRAGFLILNISFECIPGELVAWWAGSLVGSRARCINRCNFKVGSRSLFPCEVRCRYTQHDRNRWPLVPVWRQRCVQTEAMHSAGKTVNE